MYTINTEYPHHDIPSPTTLPRSSAPETTSHTLLLIQTLHTYVIVQTQHPRHVKIQAHHTTRRIGDTALLRLERY